MEQKKSWKADLESKRNTFFLIGLVVALGAVLSAFEWKSQPGKVTLSGGIPVTEFVEDLIPPTREPHVTPPPPPRPMVLKKIVIVENNIEVSEPLIEDTEWTESLPVDIPVFLENSRKDAEEQIYVNFIDEPARFPGGDQSLYQYISEHVKYPVIAQENGIQGKVYIKFIIDEQGNPINVEVARSVDPSLDAEAIRVISSLPKFKPGRQAGKFVKVYYSAVINFTLQ